MGIVAFWMLLVLRPHTRAHGPQGREVVGGV